MPRVEPIREHKTIVNIQNYLLRQKVTGKRNYILFTMCINVGFRISDLLQIKVKDIRGKTHLRIVEQKTGKPKKQLINPNLKEELEEYIKGMDDEDYLFPSRQRKQDGSMCSITRVQAYRIFKDAAEHAGLDHIGTHTGRKTFGYWYYKKYKKVAELMDIFNHSKESITLIYIGIDDDMKDESIEGLYIGSKKLKDKKHEE